MATNLPAYAPPRAQEASRSSRAGRRCGAQTHGRLAEAAASVQQREGAWMAARRFQTPEHLPTFRAHGPWTSTRLLLIALLHVPHPAARPGPVRLYCHWIKQTVHSSTTACHAGLDHRRPRACWLRDVSSSHALLAILAVVFHPALIQRIFVEARPHHAARSFHHASNRGRRATNMQARRPACDSQKPVSAQRPTALFRDAPETSNSQARISCSYELRTRTPT